MKKKSREQLNLPIDKFILIIQGSGINKRRGAEEAVEAMKNCEDTFLLIIGSGDVVEELKVGIDKENLYEKVRFLPKMPYSEMMHYTMNADLGLAIDHTDILNHKLALPNKFFDYIQAEIPILATDIIEIRKIIEKYQIGYILNGQLTAMRMAEIIKAIQIEYPEKIRDFKKNLLRAKKTENWEGELIKLKEIYAHLN